MSVVTDEDHDDLWLSEKASPEQEARSLLTLVWQDGRFHRTANFSEIRRRLLQESQKAPYSPKR